MNQQAPPQALPQAPPQALPPLYKANAPFNKIYKISAIVMLTVVLSIIGLPWILLGKQVPIWISIAWHKTALKILNIRVNIHGKKIQSRKSGMFCSNHLSYLDIMVLGSVIGGRFVSRADVRHWPFIGYLARRQGTIFIERNKKHAEKHITMLGNALNKSLPLIVFAEGTSTDGVTVLPMKSTLFQPLISNTQAQTDSVKSIPIQPVTISYKKHGGLPMGRVYEPLCAWYGDMDLASHLSEFLALGAIEVEVIFHPTTSIENFDGNRKLLAENLHQTIKQGLTKLRQYRL